MASKDLWYQKAIYYELYVRAFRDSNGDGWGDLKGVVEKLGYIKELGVDAIWLLPISPSPLRDDGYDVSDFRGIHPMYGNRDDFHLLVSKAHDLGLRIVVELVPNHTSDQHYWFQASRDPDHPQHEKYKDYYVWSVDNQKYKDARIIFIDSEDSNWTYDPVRKMYYWHRFFFHQPDLNYDNPEVQQEMLDIIKYWIDEGVDGIRVDAPPYLFEREGTNCENLKETHEFLQRLRSFVDEFAPETLLLSEANQWPEDVIQYFGTGNEMKMNFHFPLMPRLFMAVAKENRSVIEEILARTPQLPDGCQWGTFLRCHDELTLEMVTENDRQWMWEKFAPDNRMRLNLGIRRRLAPLMDNDERKILLMYSLLFTIGGAPFLYYGDEIGMGDNILMKDRDGLRTPMQWNGNLNAGFSEAMSDALYAQVIQNETFGFSKINVKVQEENPNSLLNKIRHLIKARKQYSVFSDGSFKWMVPAAESIAAYYRTNDKHKMLVLNNLGHKSEKIEIPDKSINYLNIIDGKLISKSEITLKPFEFLWLLEQNRS